MAESFLQVSFHTDLVSGGYGRTNGKPSYACNGQGCYTPGTLCDLVECVDRSCGYFYDNPTWQDTGYTGEREFTYYWRDSNEAINSRSSEGYATIRDTWSATPDDQNNLIITHNTYLVAWGRQDIRGNPRPTPGRGLAIYRAVNGNYTKVADMGTSNVNQEYHSGGNIHIGTFTYVLPPQTSSRGKYPNTGTLVRNWVLGYANDQPSKNAAEIYIDMMFLGADFKNNLPNQFLPPVLDRIEQVADICEDHVIMDAYFEAPSMSGAKLEFQYWYNGETSSDARTMYVDPVTAGVPPVVQVKPVFPSRGEGEKVTVFWRARYVSNNPALKDSDWTYGYEEVIFIPPPNMSVPDISAQECNSIMRGVLIPPYEEITWYGKDNE